MWWKWHMYIMVSFCKESEFVKWLDLHHSYMFKCAELWLEINNLFNVFLSRLWIWAEWRDIVWEWASMDRFRYFTSNVRYLKFILFLFYYLLIVLDWCFDHSFTLNFVLIIRCCCGAWGWGWSSSCRHGSGSFVIYS